MQNLVEKIQPGKQVVGFLGVLVILAPLYVETARTKQQQQQRFYYYLHLLELTLSGDRKIWVVLSDAFSLKDSFEG